MQDAQHYNQAVTESRKSDRIVQFITADKFTESIQNLMDNGNVWGAYFEKSGALVFEDRDGRKHYNVLADGGHARKIIPARWVVVQPMTGSEEGGQWKSSKSAEDARKKQRLSSAHVVMTANQWAKFKGQCQKPGLTEAEQRAFVSKIVGYDY